MKNGLIKIPTNGVFKPAILYEVLKNGIKIRNINGCLIILILCKKVMYLYIFLYL